jgi:hypothetical protein
LGIWVRLLASGAIGRNYSIPQFANAITQSSIQIPMTTVCGYGVMFARSAGDKQIDTA